MVEKKPAKPVPATTAAKPTTPNPGVRPSLPALTPLPEEKPEAPDAKPSTPAGTTTAPADTTKPASAPAEESAAPAPASKAAEVLAKKIRTKAEILAALRAGSHIQHTDAGLYRVVEVSGTVHPASKRRILSLIEQGILKASDSDKRKYVFDAEAEKKAEKKPPASAPAPAKSEPPISTKTEETK